MAGVEHGSPACVKEFVDKARPKEVRFVSARGRIGVATVRFAESLDGAVARIFKKTPVQREAPAMGVFLV